ncbi:hypothetical protein [Halostella litorea]|uniref:hypothetical protein n=1 Tax=Halostella litorea TaxID=2528831 RepID=UPI00109222C7|nr:hypothetical protein [Halostella litorea]
MLEPLRPVLFRVLQVQPDSGFHVDIDLGTGLGGGAVGAFLTTLAVGAIMIAVVPEYTERMMESLADEPVDALVYGLACLVGLVLLIVLLVFSLIGIVAAVPLALVAWLAWAVGSAVAFLTIGERLVGRDDGWLKPLLLGAVINGGLAATGVGGIIAFVVGAAGFGTVLQSQLG